MNNLIVRLAKCAQTLEDKNMVHDAAIVDAVVARLAHYQDDDNLDMMNDAAEEIRRGTGDNCEECGHRSFKGSGEIVFDPETERMLCTECRDGNPSGWGDVDDIDYSPEGYL